jgi:hypothetical protein
MRLANILITVLLIGGFSMGFAGFFGSIASPSCLTSHNFTSMNYINQVANTTQSMYGIVNESQTQSFSSGNILSIAPVNLLFGAYNAGMLILQTPIFFYSMIYDLTSILGFPAWVAIMLYGIILIIVVFSIISFITGRAAD